MESSAFLRSLSDDCERLCASEDWVGPGGAPNFRLLYSAAGTFKAGNGFAFIGMNPAGGPLVASTDDRDRPFTDPNYSAYLDDRWGGYERGQDSMQRAVQEVALALAGASLAQIISARGDQSSLPERRIGAKAVALLRGALSGNIIPFRDSDLRKIPARLRSEGERIGSDLFHAAEPAPQVIVTLANTVNDLPWRNFLKRSPQPKDTTFSRLIHKKLNRTYREIRLQNGPLAGTLLVGLPAVVRDRGKNDEVMRGILATLVERRPTIVGSLRTNRSV